MRLSLKLFLFAAVALTGWMFVSGCAKEEAIKPSTDLQIEGRGPILGGGGGGGLGGGVALIGLSPNNELLHLLSGPPAQVTAVIPIGGMRTDEVIIAIDTRPKTKELYGVSNTDLLFKIDKNTGATRLVSTSSFNPGLEGGILGIDFDPQLDILRVVTDGGQNLRISPTTGAVIGVDISFDATPVAFNGLAYAAAISFSGKPDLFAIDINGDAVYRITNAATGANALLGFTGYNWTGEGGFEITPGKQVFAVQYGYNKTPKVTINGDDTSIPYTRLYSISTFNGKAYPLGRIRDMIGLATK